MIDRLGAYHRRIKSVVRHVRSRIRWKLAKRNRFTNKFSSRVSDVENWSLGHFPNEREVAVFAAVTADIDMPMNGLGVEIEATATLIGGVESVHRAVFH